MSVDEDNSLEAKFGTTVDTAFGSYNVAQWSGQNDSGMRPVCDLVIVLPDQSVQVTQGGIIIPDQAQEMVGLAATTGILVAVGPQAFAYDSQRLVHWVGERPQPGERVFFKKYAGQEHGGRDGMMYRIMLDRDIAATEDPVPEVVEPTDE